MLDVRANWKSLTSAEKIEAVRPLVAQGMSSSQIAAQFQNVSRNSIIGLCHRTGMKLGGQAGRNRLYQKPPARKSPAKQHGNKGQPKVYAIVRRASAKASLPPMPIPMDDETDVGVDVTSRVGFMDLTNYTCRWPVGGAVGSQQMFCGCRADLNSTGPYCAEHTAKSEERQ